MMKKLKWFSSMKTYNLPRANTKNTCPFHHRALQSKNRKSRDTWSNSKFGLGVQNEVGQRLAEFCQENMLVRANTLLQQHKRWLYTWILLDSQYQNQIDYILCSWRWRSSIQSAKTRPQSMNSFLPNSDLKKVEKTTRPFRYDLNQVPYDYTVEMTNRFKGLDLVDRVPEELCTEVCNIVQEAMTKTIPKKKKCNKAKWSSEEAL